MRRRRLRHCIALGAEVLDPWTELLVELHHPRKAGHHALVGLAAGIAERQQARIERGVRVAEERGIVACRAQLTREIGMPVVERRAVADRAMIVRVESRQQRGARGPTG